MVYGPIATWIRGLETGAVSPAVRLTTADRQGLTVRTWCDTQDSRDAGAWLACLERSGPSIKHRALFGSTDHLQNLRQIACRPLEQPAHSGQCFELTSPGGAPVKLFFMTEDTFFDIGGRGVLVYPQEFEAQIALQGAYQFCCNEARLAFNPAWATVENASRMLDALRVAIDRGAPVTEHITRLVAMWYESGADTALNNFLTHNYARQIIPLVEKLGQSALNNPLHRKEFLKLLSFGPPRIRIIAIAVCARLHGPECVARCWKLFRDAHRASLLSEHPLIVRETVTELRYLALHGISEATGMLQRLTNSAPQPTDRLGSQKMQWAKAQWARLSEQITLIRQTRIPDATRTDPILGYLFNQDFAPETQTVDAQTQQHPQPVAPQPSADETVAFQRDDYELPAAQVSTEDGIDLPVIADGEFEIEVL
ncbi:MAG: hypothetical protein HQM16_17780 [Deltaproteobacteria bacterium]|nr:hypothetical protein [Deltaproteobacteria bacterium]